MNIQNIALALTIHLAAAVTGFAQGSLIPPGPPGPTMKTLDESEPRVPISFLPYTITNSGSFYLTTNLVGIAGTNGITVSAVDVTIDLRGFTLRGVPGAKDGITGLGDRLVVHDGTIRGWSNGIYALTIGCQLRNLFLYGNGTNGTMTGAFSLIENCVAEFNSGYGLRVAQGSIVRKCSLAGNAVAGFMNYGLGIANAHQSALVSDCTFSDNSGDGAFLANSCFFTGNNVTGNTGSGVVISGKGCTVERNHISANGYGVLFGSNSRSNLVVRNFFQGNINSAIVTNAGAASIAVGPFVDGATIGTNQSPHANYSF